MRVKLKLKGCTRKRSPVIGLNVISLIPSHDEGKAHLQLRHKCLHGVKEFSCCRVRNLLLVQPLFECREQIVEFSRFDHGPRYYVQFTSMEASDEIGVLFLLHNLLELERKPTINCD